MTARRISFWSGYWDVTCVDMCVLRGKRIWCVEVSENGRLLAFQCHDPGSLESVVDGVGFSIGGGDCCPIGKAVEGSCKISPSVVDQRNRAGGRRAGLRGGKQEFGPAKIDRSGHLDRCLCCWSVKKEVERGTRLQNRYRRGCGPRGGDRK